MKDPLIRPLQESDPIPAITGLLHEAYAPLAAMGLRFTATHQDDAVTLRRLSRGLSWVAEQDGEIVATVSLYPTASETGSCAWYREPGVWSFGQFADWSSTNYRSVVMSKSLPRV